MEGSILRFARENHYWMTQSNKPVMNIDLEFYKIIDGKMADCAISSLSLLTLDELTILSFLHKNIDRHTLAKCSAAPWLSENKRLTASIRLQHVTRIRLLFHHFPRLARQFL